MEAQELLAHQSRVGGDRGVDSRGDRHATRESLAMAALPKPTAMTRGISSKPDIARISPMGHRPQSRPGAPGASIQNNSGLPQGPADPSPGRLADAAKRLRGWSLARTMIGRGPFGKGRVSDMRRRDFITVLGGAVAWPLAARGQQSPMPMVGFLNSSSPDADGDRVRAYRRGLREVGYLEGRNVTIEYRWADGQNERLPSLAADLVHRGVNVIVTGGTPATKAAKAATTSIPIVFILSTDPVEAGLVSSLNRPGGNLTGVTGLNVSLAPKKLELLHELLPAVTTPALLVNPTNAVAAENQARTVQAAAQTLGLQLHVLHASTERDFDSVFVSLVRLRAGALVIGSDLFFTSWSEQLAAL